MPACRWQGQASSSCRSGRCASGIDAKNDLVGKGVGPELLARFDDVPQDKLAKGDGVGVAPGVIAIDPAVHGVGVFVRCQPVREVLGCIHGFPSSAGRRNDCENGRYSQGQTHRSTLPLAPLASSRSGSAEGCKLTAGTFLATLDRFRWRNFGECWVQYGTRGHFDYR